MSLPTCLVLRINFLNSSRGQKVTEQLDSFRLNQVTEFKAIFRKCELMANFSDVSVTVPRTVQRQTMHSNVQHNSPEEYFRKSIFLPLLDGLLEELHDRLQGKSKAIVLVPSNFQDCDVEAGIPSIAFS